MNLSKYAANLQNACERIDESPVLAGATWFLGLNDTPRIYTFVYDIKSARALLVGTGKWEKRSDKNNLMFVQRSLLDDVWEIQVIMSHESVNCRKVLTGNKVTHKVSTGYVEVEEDEYVWECPDSILQ